VRFQASSWIFKHIPDRSYILSETANVVDLPLENTNFVVISFNYYDVDSEPSLQSELYYHIRQAQYIFVPSRRIFKNNIKYYPLLDQYYHNLFSGKLGFRKVAEFTAYPKIELFGKKIFEFPDEDAEETWTVFDHPVIRIYARK
jgi:hypothetical protein